MTKFHAKFPNAEFGRGALIVGGVVPKLGSVRDVRGRKISLNVTRRLFICEPSITVGLIGVFADSSVLNMHLDSFFFS